MRSPGRPPSARLVTCAANTIRLAASRPSRSNSGSSRLDAVIQGFNCDRHRRGVCSVGPLAPALAGREKAAMKTKAAILRGPKTDWEVVDLDLDPPKANEVLIRFVAAGLCHSDEHLRSGDMPSRYPIVGGHEG